MPGSGNPPPVTTTGSTPTPTGGGSSGGSGLHNKFKAKGKLYFGTEIDHYHLNNNALTTIVKNSFGQVTHENSLKWDATERKCCPAFDEANWCMLTPNVNHASEPQPIHLLQR